MKLRERVFTPTVLIIFLSIVNLLIYFDRGAIAAVLPKVKDHFDLTSTEEGAIASAFMVGYMIFSLVFAELANRIPMNFVMMFGLLMWALSAACVGLAGVMTDDAWGYYFLIGARTFVGVGEASFLPLAPSFIDDIIVDKTKRTTVLSLFFAGIPVGIAIGYGVAGTLASFFSWQVPFFVEAALMVFYCIIIAFIPSKTKHHHQEPAASAGSKEETQGLVKSEQDKTNEEVDQFLGEYSTFAADTMPLTTEVPPVIPDEILESTTPSTGSKAPSTTAPRRRMNIFIAMKVLMCNSVYITAVACNTAYTAVLGALSFWAPSFISKNLKLKLEVANLGFSIVSLFCGLLGTAFGGIILDKVLGGSAGKKGTTSSCFAVFAFLIIAFPFGLAALIVNNAIAFFILLTIAEFFLFAQTSPINCALLTCVPKDVRTYSMSFYIFAIHLFGDFPSPFLFGIVTDVTESLKISMVGLWLVLILAILFAFIAWRTAHSKFRKQLNKQRTNQSSSV